MKAEGKGSLRGLKRVAGAIILQSHRGELRFGLRRKLIQGW